MKLLTCPYCGARNISEFRYGGEYAPRPANPLDSTDQAWSDYIYMKQNVVGVQKEWWHHVDGCGAWFLAERHTKTNVVLKTFLFEK